LTRERYYILSQRNRMWRNGPNSADAKYRVPAKGSYELSWSTKPLILLVWWWTSMKIVFVTVNVCYR